MKLKTTLKSVITAGIFVLIVSGCKSLDAQRMKLYDQVAQQVMKQPLPDLEVGQSNIASSGNLEIWYELIKTRLDSARGTVLFIEGLEGTAMGWGKHTYQPILEAGYNVIRMDNREVGRSTWTENIDYDLTDMADDVLAVVNELDLDSVHIVGQSMGGMIAQEFALHYPEKVKTLTLIYTSGNINDKSLPGPSNDFIRSIITAYSEYGKDDLVSKIKLELATMDISNVAPLEYEDLIFVAQRTRYEIEKRKGKNENASAIQQKAIDNSGSRYDKLVNLKMPVLIIHGQKDPLIPIAHGKKLAILIPHAKSIWVENYGHNIPKGFSMLIIKELIRLIE